ncbi:MAG: VWA domain-containing protein [Rhodothermales bacterium]
MSVISKTKKLLAGAVFTSIAMAGSTHAATSNSDILFILDGSGSMWGQIEGVAKIQTAKDTLTNLLDDVPESARLGLMTYGTTDKQSCSDVVLLNGLGADRAQIKESISALKPLGKTPIGLSLINGIATLSETEPTDVQKSLVLISDGIATCDGDPCTIAAASKFSGASMKVHVVGFDVDAEAQKQLECIARSGNGQYFNASNTQGFKDAMQAVVEVAQVETKPEPVPEPVVEKPKGPIITEFFRDDFDGEELGEIWDINNPNPDNFIIEDGILTMLSTSPGGFSVEGTENFFTYTGELPKGDWDAVVTFTGDYAAMSDRLVLGMGKDNKSYLSSAFNMNFFWAASCHSSSVDLYRSSKGKEETISAPYRGTRNTHCRAAQGQYDESWDSLRADLQEIPVILTFSKRGRAYTANVKMEGYNNADGEQIVATTEQFTSLRSPGDLSFSINRNKTDVEGEVLMNIDSFVINEVK